MDTLLLLGPAGLCLLAFAGFVALIVWLVIWSRHKEKQRTDDLRAVAEQLGLPFYPEGDPGLISALAQFKLFSQGTGKMSRNMLHGQTEDLELGIFEYQYTTGSGDDSHTWRQSVVSFRSTHLNLPDFALRPENFFHRIGKVFGYKDINFEAHPGFSQAFLLRGSDETRIREVFSDEVLSFFETAAGVCVEARGDRLLYYRGGVRVEPAKIRSFMDEGFKVYMLFRSPQKRTG